MKKKILIRFGDMMLKGKNIGFFIKRVRTHMIARLKDLNVNMSLLMIVYIYLLKSKTK
jgi:tRNA uracil 4-sulfurtransferase